MRGREQERSRSSVPPASDASQPAEAAGIPERGIPAGARYEEDWVIKVKIGGAEVRVAISPGAQWQRSFEANRPAPRIRMSPGD
ncbi:MAG TPA: hypothetical protein VFC84_19515 [Desulfosporosinus sp.]|nr:hypothetical protein [Desulfosporosinus sp.]